MLQRIRSIPGVIVACLAGALLAACAAPPVAEFEEGPVFPPPPDTPRFVFEVSLVNSAQIVRMDRRMRLRLLATGEHLHGRAMPKPFDVAACGGLIYVSDTVARKVFAFDPAGARSFSIGDQHPGLLAKPMGLAVDGNCRLYVADISQSRIVVYDSEGRYLAALGGAGMFERLSYVAVDARGERLYAVDTGGVQSMNHRVRVFSVASGEHLFDIGTRGGEDGQFNLPRGIAVAPNGTVYVVDSANFRVQAFDSDGRFLRKFGSLGRQFGQFARPKGIAVDREGRVYVADTSFGNFQIFDEEARLLLFIGDRGADGGPARYMLPNGIAVDEDGRVYLVDQFFSKVDIFRPAALARTDGRLGAWYR
jgi:sugar lactone lactonase YvrE